MKFAVSTCFRSILTLTLAALLAWPGSLLASWTGLEETATDSGVVSGPPRLARLPGTSCLESSAVATTRVAESDDEENEGLPKLPPSLAQGDQSVVDSLIPTNRDVERNNQPPDFRTAQHCKRLRC
jgi:hypothetical protein